MEQRVKRRRVVKKKAAPVVTSLVAMFTSKDYTSIIIPMLHAFDVIHLSMTCKEMYEAYRGHKLRKSIAYVVNRDCGTKYINNPLPFMGHANNVHDFDGHLSVKYRSLRCARCAKTMGRHDYNSSPSKYCYCLDCQGYEQQFQSYVYPSPDFRSFLVMYEKESDARMVRLINREAVDRGKEIDALPCIYLPSGGWKKDPASKALYVRNLRERFARVARVLHLNLTPPAQLLFMPYLREFDCTDTSI